LKQYFQNRKNNTVGSGITVIKRRKEKSIKEEYFDDGDHWNKISVMLRLKPTMRFLELTNKLRG